MRVLMTQQQQAANRQQTSKEKIPPFREHRYGPTTNLDRLDYFQTSIQAWGSEPGATTRTRLHVVDSADFTSENAFSNVRALRGTGINSVIFALRCRARINCFPSGQGPNGACDLRARHIIGRPACILT